ncbi:hypothetical protein BKA61DRAFT_720699 [Leptodontidium sp. MPI-SDFR-AT-0119]|nr:hypothetical protein BKA61DRAFT_720699 [Leptodontidium sp. MPI-SDFR-AT-0119]
MAPGKHDTCPCGFTWDKSKDGDGYICRGGHHSITGDGLTPSEAAWVKQRAADKKKADEEDSRQRDLRRRETKLREEQARKAKETADAAAAAAAPYKKRVEDEDSQRRDLRKRQTKLWEEQARKDRETADAATAAYKKKKEEKRIRQEAPPKPIRESEDARARRKSREREAEELKASRYNREISIPEPQDEVKQTTQSTSSQAHSSSKKTPGTQLAIRQPESGRTRQQRQDDEIKASKEKDRQRRQECLNNESGAERAEAWARIKATHASAPTLSPQTPRRPRALPAPDPPSSAPASQTTRHPRALPAPAPAPASVVEPMPWMRAPAKTSRSQRELELVPVSRSKQKEKEKMPWE